MAILPPFIGFNAPASVQFQLYLLDEVPVLATEFVGSLYRPTIDYTDRMVRIRRDIDNVLCDINFGDEYMFGLNCTISNVEGATGAVTLGQFVGAAGYTNPDNLLVPANAFVRYFYTLGGRLNLGQAANSSQPQIIRDGAVITNSKGQPVIDFNSKSMSWSRGTMASSTSCVMVGAFGLQQVAGSTMKIYDAWGNGNWQQRRQVIQFLSDSVIRTLWAGGGGPLNTVSLPTPGIAFNHISHVDIGVGNVTHYLNGEINGIAEKTGNPPAVESVAPFVGTSTGGFFHTLVVAVSSTNYSAADIAAMSAWGNSL